MPKYHSAVYFIYTVLVALCLSLTTVCKA